LKGCGLVLSPNDFHEFATYEVDACDPCADLLLRELAQARAEAIEWIVKAIEDFTPHSIAPLEIARLARRLRYLQLPPADAGGCGHPRALTIGGWFECPDCKYKVFSP